MKIPPRQTPRYQIEQAYAFARECYRERKSIAEKNDFFDSIKLNRTSGHGFVQWYKHYLHGTKMARTMSLEATKYYFDKINEEFGPEILKNSIKAARIHVDYYENIPLNVQRNIRLVAKRELCDDYEKLLVKSLIAGG